MEDEQYDAIRDYLERGVYPDGFKKSQKFILRRSCKGYKLVKGKVYYKDQASRFFTVNVQSRQIFEFLNPLKIRSLRHLATF